ncbi:MAG: cytidylyltransferase domain-containing protein, partial [Chitinophagaceae bacterium]
AYGEVIIVTSTDKSNDLLVNYCEENNIESFRGSEEDVLSRFLAIASSNRFDHIVRLTGDNPIIDPGLLIAAIKNHIESRADYTKTAGLPLGMNFEIMTVGALLSMKSKELSPEEHEHVTLHFKRNNSYNSNTYSIDTKEEISQLRLTIDYPSDFIVLSTILTLKSPNSSGSTGLSFVEAVYEKYPWIFDLNRTNFQKKQFNNAEEELDEAYKLLLNLDFKKAAEKLKSAN